MTSEESNERLGLWICELYEREKETGGFLVDFFGVLEIGDGKLLCLSSRSCLLGVIGFPRVSGLWSVGPAISEVVCL